MRRPATANKQKNGAKKTDFTVDGKRLGNYFTMRPQRRLWFSPFRTLRSHAQHGNGTRRQDKRQARSPRKRDNVDTWHYGTWILRRVACVRPP